MGPIKRGLLTLKETGSMDALLAALREHTPTRPRSDEPRDPIQENDPEPIAIGKPFDDVTVAWMSGALTDEQYELAVEAAAASSTEG